MKVESPYFFIENKTEIHSVKDLIELNKPKKYSDIGELYSPKESLYLESGIINPNFIHQHETCGIFRGQLCDWPLMPSSYRNVTPVEKIIGTIEFTWDYCYRESNSDLEKFCKDASKQNYNFPKSIIEQIEIGQHYGINTPLLDWSTNIFVAAYFALAHKMYDEVPESADPSIYHLKDERYLQPIDDSNEKISRINYSALVKPYLIDRRIDRQFSIFSFHPHPIHEPKRIPVDKYSIS